MGKNKNQQQTIFSPIVQGFWRLQDWNFSKSELLKFIEQLLEMGISGMDHADIYGNYDNEKIFGESIGTQKSLRSKMQLISKCGIKLTSDKFPERNIKYYDYSYAHIIHSVNASLKNFNTDYLDILLLHRPSPIMNYEEIAKAFSQLKQEGKVLHFGVSNFSASHTDILNHYLSEPLICNQIEISPLHLEYFENGVLDHLEKNNIRPMAWSPLAGGRIMNPTTKKEQKLHDCLKNIAKESGIQHIDQVTYAWLFHHPSGIIPVNGSGKIEHIQRAFDGQQLKLSLEQWFKIYICSQGHDLP